MTLSSIIQAGYPCATDEDITYILWSRTPYPIGAVTAKSLYNASRRVWRAHTHNIRLCDCCNNRASRGRILCKKCAKLFASNL
jgi:hypothetical protein